MRDEGPAKRPGRNAAASLIAASLLFCFEMEAPVNLHWSSFRISRSKVERMIVTPKSAEHGTITVFWFVQTLEYANMNSVTPSSTAHAL